MTARRIPRTRVDTIANLHAAYTAAKEAYEKAVTPLRIAGVAVYPGSEADIVVSSQSRETTDWPAVCKVAKVPARTIKRFTRRTPFHRVDIVARGS